MIGADPAPQEGRTPAPPNEIEHALDEIREEALGYANSDAAWETGLDNVLISIADKAKGARAAIGRALAEERARGIKEAARLLIEEAEAGDAAAGDLSARGHDESAEDLCYGSSILYEMAHKVRALAGAPPETEAPTNSSNEEG